MDLRKELEYIDLFADDNPKNYQIWYHRRAVTEKLGDPTNELEFCTRVFEVDSKNYHAWAYRLYIPLMRQALLIFFRLDNGYYKHLDYGKMSWTT